MISTLRCTSRRSSENAPVPCMHFACYDLMDYQQRHSMKLQELPPWLNLCMLLRPGGALLGLSTGYASTVLFVEHFYRMGYLPRETPEAAVLVGDAEDGLLAAVTSCSARVLLSIFHLFYARRPGLRPRPH